MKINGQCLEQVKDSSGLVQEEAEMEIVSSGAVQQKTELETDLSKLVQQETHLDGLDQQEPEQVIESSGLENTELNEEHQEPKMNTFSVEPSTQPAAVPSHSPNKTPMKVRDGKTDMCGVEYGEWNVNIIIICSRSTFIII